MAPQFLAEVPMYLALFLCGAAGYFATRWANKRLFASRFPPLQAKKLHFENEGEDEEEEPAAEELTVTTVQSASPFEPESEPTAVSSPARLPARRRSVRKSGAAMVESSALAAEEVAPRHSEEAPATEEAVAAEVVELAAHDEEEPAPMPALEHGDDDDDDTPVEAPAAPAQDEEQPERFSSGEEPSKCGADAFEPAYAEELPAAPQQEDEEVAVSARVARMLARKAARKERKAMEQRLLLERAHGEQRQALLAKVEDAPAPMATEEPALDVIASEDGASQDAPEATKVTEEAVQEEDQEDEVEEAEEGFALPQTSDVFEEVLAAKVEAQECVPEASPEGPIDLVPMELVNVGADGRRFSAILSPDGQQLYTDGEEVYVMACLEGPEGADPEAAPVLHGVITDPTSPWHQVLMGLGVAEQQPPIESVLMSLGISEQQQPVESMPPPYLAGRGDAPAQWTPPAAEALERPWIGGASSSSSSSRGWGRRRRAYSNEDPSDKLWDTCWEFAA